MVFLLVAALALIYILFFTGPKKGVLQPTAVVPEAPVVPGFSPTAETEKPVLRNVKLAWERDPFLLPKPPEGKAARPSKTSLRLVGILDGNNGRFAILDEEVVRKGDVVGGERIQEVGKDRVVLVRGNVKRVLSLEETLPEALVKKDGAQETKKKTEKVVK